MVERLHARARYIGLTLWITFRRSIGRLPCPSSRLASTVRGAPGRCRWQDVEDRRVGRGCQPLRRAAREGREARVVGPRPVWPAGTEGDGAPVGAAEPLGRRRSAMPDASVAGAERWHPCRGDQRRVRARRGSSREAARETCGLRPGRRSERPGLRTTQSAAPTSAQAASSAPLQMRMPLWHVNGRVCHRLGQWNPIEMRVPLPDSELAPERPATEVPGLSAMDVERARSMADEGGASAAIADAVDFKTLSAPSRSC